MVLTTVKAVRDVDRDAEGRVREARCVCVCLCVCTLCVCVCTLCVCVCVCTLHMLKRYMQEEWNDTVSMWFIIRYRGRYVM